MDRKAWHIGMQFILMKTRSESSKLLLEKESKDKKDDMYQECDLLARLVRRMKVLSLSSEHAHKG